jgi:hypothetical protein
VRSKRRAVRRVRRRGGLRGPSQGLRAGPHLRALRWRCRRVPRVGRRRRRVFLGATAGRRARRRVDARDCPGDAGDGAYAAAPPERLGQGQLAPCTQMGALPGPMPGQQTEGAPTSASQPEHGHDVHGVAGTYAVQWAAAHSWLGAHTVPHVPQYGTLASRSTHAKRPFTGQGVSPPGQLPARTWQPFAHDSPASHAFPQPPQLPTFDVRSAHKPFGHWCSPGKQPHRAALQ